MLAAAARAGAQTAVGPTGSADSVTAIAHAGTDARVLSRRNLAVAGLAVAATFAVAPFDERSARFFQSPRLQNESDLSHAARSAAFMGGPGPFLLGATLFVGGRLTRVPPVADLGLHLTEGVLLAASITALGKGITGRAIPQQAGGEADNIQFGRGFHRGNGPFVSFPSGHTAAGFAMAAVLTSEAARWHPEAARVVGPLAYGGASLIGIARMYQNVHWASDLPVAAAIGTWSGMAVVAHQHGHPHNRLDRWLLGAGIAPAGNGGVMLTWSAPASGAAR